MDVESLPMARLVDGRRSLLAAKAEVAIVRASNEDPDLMPKPINWTNFSTLACVAVLVGTETVGLSWAAGWALGGIFQLPTAFAHAVEILFGLIGFVALYFFMRAAVKVEPIRG